MVTGGNGLIGSHLHDRLVDQGDNVSRLDLHFDLNAQTLKGGNIVGDVRDIATVRKAIDNKNLVFHLAAVSRVVWGETDPLKCWTTNLVGTLNVLEACRTTPSKPIVVYASSREVYGEPTSFPVKEEHPKNPKSVYGGSKFAAEQLCAAYNRAFDAKIIVVRFSNVYGSKRDLMDRVTPKFMIQAMRNEDISLYGGDQVLDFCFIDDVVTGLLKIRDKSADGAILGEDFNFVTGVGTSVARLAELVKEACHSDSRIIRQDSKSYDVQRFIGDPEKSRKKLGLVLETGLQQGLKILRRRLADAPNHKYA